TKFQLLAPDGDNNPTNNPVASSCSQLDLDGMWFNAADVDNGIDDPATMPRSFAEPRFGATGTKDRDYYQNFKLNCTIPAGSVGSDTTLPCVLKVWSDPGQGPNQFSILALHDVATTSPPPASDPPTDGLQVYAQQRLPLFAAKYENGDADFFVARVRPSGSTS